MKQLSINGIVKDKINWVFATIFLNNSLNYQVGANVRVDCLGDGYPTPTSTWIYKPDHDKPGILLPYPPRYTNLTMINQVSYSCIHLEIQT